MTYLECFFYVSSTNITDSRDIFEMRLFLASSTNITDRKDISEMLFFFFWYLHELYYEQAYLSSGVDPMWILLWIILLDKWSGSDVDFTSNKFTWQVVLIRCWFVCEQDKSTSGVALKWIALWTSLRDTWCVSDVDSTVKKINRQVGSLKCGLYCEKVYSTSCVDSNKKYRCFSLSPVTISKVL